VPLIERCKSPQEEHEHAGDDITTDDGSPKEVERCVTVPVININGYIRIEVSDHGNK